MTLTVRLDCLFLVAQAGGVTITEPRTRRTQAQRTAATQRALLDAAVEALAELGYAGATTTEIARRAGVSRGAQLHHYPTKHDLVSAALDHVFAQSEAEFRRRFSERPLEERTQAGAVETLWEVCQGPEQLAVLELLTAARPDAELAPLAREVLQRFQAGVVATYCEVLPGAAEDPFVAQRVLLALAVLQAASLHQHLGLADEAASLMGTLTVLADLVPLLTDADGGIATSARPAEAIAAALLS